MLRVRLPTHESSELRARDLIRTHFADRLPAVTLYDLLTVVSELAVNAIRHGQGDEIELAIELSSDGAVSGEVTNEGSGDVRPLDPDPDGRGLGLRIVAAVAAKWHAESDGVTRVSFVLRSPSPSADP